MSTSLFLIVTLFFIPTVISYDFITTTASSENCFVTLKWHMIVTSNIPDEIKLYIKGEEMDKDIYLSFGQAYGWYFCQHNHFTSQITWGSKNVTMDLYNKHIKNLCFRYVFPLGTIHCYWLIRPEGFYVSRHNSPFPNSNWRFQRGWN
ncbi:hypothetical protein R6Q59_011483 [Mikania micrantha]